MGCSSDLAALRYAGSPLSQSEVVQCEETLQKVEDCHYQLEMGCECVELPSQIASLEECQRQERSIVKETTDGDKTYALGS